MQFILFLLGGAIATTSVFGVAVLSWMAEISSTSLGYIASCAPSPPEEKCDPQNPSTSSTSCPSSSSQS